MTEKLVQTFSYGRASLAVHADTEGDLLVVESDCEGITVYAWKVKYLVQLAKDYEKTRQLEKLEEKQAQRWSQIESKVRTLELGYSDLFKKSLRWWQK